MAEQVDTPATLLDLSPTILDAVRLPVPQAMQGKSMLAAAGLPGTYSARAFIPRSILERVLLPACGAGTTSTSRLPGRSSTIWPRIPAS